MTVFHPYLKIAVGVTSARIVIQGSDLDLQVDLLQGQIFETPETIPYDALVKQLAKLVEVRKGRLKCIPSLTFNISEISLLLILFPDTPL